MQNSNLNVVIWFNLANDTTSDQIGVLENLDLKEKASLSFLFGPSNITVTSHVVGALQLFYSCMMNRSHDPYSKTSVRTGLDRHYTLMLFYCSPHKKNLQIDDAVTWSYIR